MTDGPPRNEGSLADDLNTLKTDGLDPVIANDLDLYRQTQREILAIETRKTRKLLFIIAAILLASNLLILLKLRDPIEDVITDLLIIPAIIAAFGFMAFKEPLVAAILAMLVLFGVWIYNYTILGMVAIIQGWLVKIIVLTLLIACIQHARLANKIKRELKL